MALYLGSTKISLNSGIKIIETAQLLSSEPYTHDASNLQLFVLKEEENKNE